MAKNISLLGADYQDVPAVVLPKTGGGSAMFVDADDVIKYDTQSLTSDANGYAKLTNISIANHILLSASGSGFMAIPFNGGDGYWYVRFTNPADYTKLNGITRDIQYTYIKK